MKSRIGVNCPLNTKRWTRFTSIGPVRHTVSFSYVSPTNKSVLAVFMQGLKDTWDGTCFDEKGFICISMNFVLKSNYLLSFLPLVSLPVSSRDGVFGQRVFVPFPSNLYCCRAQLQDKKDRTTGFWPFV